MNSSSRSRLIKSFFVIKPDDCERYIYTVRTKVLDLVHYGFTREEIYFMPLSELIDYIEILNDRHKDNIVPQVEDKGDDLNNLKMMADVVPMAY